MPFTTHLPNLKKKQKGWKWKTIHNTRKKMPNKTSDNFSLFLFLRPINSFTLKKKKKFEGDSNFCHFYRLIRGSVCDFQVWNLFPDKIIFWIYLCWLGIGISIVLAEILLKMERNFLTSRNVFCITSKSFPICLEQGKNEIGIAHCKTLWSFKKL